MSSHDHDPSHDHHHHSPGTSTLVPALALILAFACMEAVAGWWAGSLVLLADAGLMVLGGLALAIGGASARFVPQPGDQTNFAAIRKALLLICAFTSLTMLLVISILAWHAIDRLGTPVETDSTTVITVAIAGIALNLVVARLLSRDESGQDPRSLQLPVLANLLGSAVALVCGIGIHLHGWSSLDPLLSMLICGVILAGTLLMLHQGVLEAAIAPPKLWPSEVGEAMLEIDGVVSVSHLHIWYPGPETRALSGHVVLSRDDWAQIQPRLQAMLLERFKIGFTTLEPQEPPRKVIQFTPPKSNDG